MCAGTGELELAASLPPAIMIAGRVASLITARAASPIPSELQERCAARVSMRSGSADYVRSCADFHDANG